MPPKKNLDEWEEEGNYGKRFMEEVLQLNSLPWQTRSSQGVDDDDGGGGDDDNTKVSKWCTVHYNSKTTACKVKIM